ncbi:SMP-30/gluconolactonase/LRE family protein [uncultured Friedmanniella sp.]|uniref:SMP-30/gluconolactonase/LRE family protein n=1 Tax=uncultured Friedmanniella sp. TaxID=335381 RepID=UPI0035CC0C33
MTAAERATDVVTYHGEGAIWFDGGLRLVDMLAGAVLTLDEATGTVTRTEVGSPVAACVRPRVSGGFVVATEREFVLFGADGAREWASPALWSEHTRFNEGSCDPLGRFLCGSMSYDGDEGAGTMWRLEPDRTVTRLFGDVTVSNGLGFSADGLRAFYVDTPTRRVDTFDVVDGQLRDRRPFARVPEGPGSPDGLTVDADGGVWVALYRGSAVHHYDADGALTDVVEVDATQVTSCTLGGPDLSTLYITTSREGLAEKEQPAAGSIFRADVGGRGLATLPCTL